MRPNSQFLKAMNLRPGKNTLKYVLETDGEMEISCETDVYFFKSETKIVVSDIDGTITKSDVLGQLMPIMGQDWTHANISELYHNIAQNGYQMVYLTSRAIGQSEITKKYIQSINQNGFVLPPGPLIMSPDRLYHSFKREVILRRPEVFKISALRDLANIFLPDEKRPIFAGFGNRDTVT